MIFKVVSYYGKKLSKSGKSYRKCWNIECKHCGKTKIVEQYTLLKNKNLKCNCNSCIDLTNKEVGDFKVVSYYGKKLSKSGKSHQIYWNTECKNCGKQKLIVQCILKRSTNLKCSKCNRIKNYEHPLNMIDITGKEVGNLKFYHIKV